MGLGGTPAAESDPATSPCQMPALRPGALGRKNAAELGDMTGLSRLGGQCGVGGAAAHYRSCHLRLGSKKDWVGRRQLRATRRPHLVRSPPPPSRPAPRVAPKGAFDNFFGPGATFGVAFGFPFAFPFGTGTTFAFAFTSEAVAFAFAGPFPLPVEFPADAFLVAFGSADDAARTGLALTSELGESSLLPLPVPAMTLTQEFGHKWWL